ncbi:hypothetical protein PV08_08096 [Exophiala spinifera]|uniref:Uncharacterized protein n=1 Tax=Exophiala spinifera TaxID=91928 RepID=A0A0D2BP89_9EURO|nr:uncharacterized protein PV08_08096 [Exophiala spinifera]KIW12909.1 hypothetical protein PV08_08096 [Exophiala spinifera]
MITSSRILAATVAVTAPYYLYNVSHSLSSVPTSNTRTESPPPSFVQSQTHLSVVNPRDHKGVTDSRSITFKLPPSRQSWSDEQILATFVQGYFGGWVFTPERRLLGLLNILLRRRIVGFSSKLRLDPASSSSSSSSSTTTTTIFPRWIIFCYQRELKLTLFAAIKDDPGRDQIWSCNDLSPSKLPPLYATLFGAFQVVDYHISTHDDDTGTGDSAGESYVDIGFGSDTTHFSGFHRFSVHRGPYDKGDHATTESGAKSSSSGTVTITNSSVACNPSANTQSRLGSLHAFHKVYAMLLFREGAARVISTP